MATANGPPRECLIDRLLAIDGDNWVRMALIEYPGLLMQAKREAAGNEICASLLDRLFPDGVPEHHDLGGFTLEDLETLFGELQASHQRQASPPGTK